MKTILKIVCAASFALIAAIFGLAAALVAGMDSTTAMLVLSIGLAAIGGATGWYRVK